jgi:hypothetical protein
VDKDHSRSEERIDAMESITLAFALYLSPSHSLSLSLFFSSLCRSNGHGDGSESGGIRVRVSEGVSLSGYQEAGYIVLPPRPPNPEGVLLNYLKKKNSYRNMYLLSQVELELGVVK